ncbi:hypothetical protein HC031_14230 [Planosporangium thailandense]|uniref:Uncharacterized protein n=1 Tax=Planosporangium thailandense TaxID=765197 RepID=A0ABX0XXY0_9ACTN|nr:hypothetical protein [Planosporangium thailandense]NJC70866.1 hypothetical protein [Planosporangium thailandense]
MDPREYPQPSNVVRLADRDLEKNILPQYGIRLSCGVERLRYAEDTSLVGSGGELYLRFTTSASCLDTLVHSLGMTDDSASEPHAVMGDQLDYHFRDVPESYGWTFNPTATYSAYDQAIGERKRIYLVVDPNGKDKDIYLIAETD